MRTHHVLAFTLVTATVGVALSGQALAADDLTVQARNTLELFEKTDPGIRKFVENSAGYVVFPRVTKGAVGVGGARGKGVLFERGKPTAEATMTQVTVGAQLGGQEYSEIIFFENAKALSDFKSGDFALAAQVSAVALAEGASKAAKYKNGVAVFTATGGGLMFEASVGGQKFSVKPLQH